MFRLLQLSDARAQSLEDVGEVLGFDEECETLENWLRESELLLSANQLGADCDDCERLRKSLDDRRAGGRPVDQVLNQRLLYL